MLIEDISTAQILTATGFLAALFLIQIFVKKNKFGIQKRLNMSKRVSVVESNKISPSEQVSIIRIDNLEFAFFSVKGTQPVIIPLENNKHNIITNNIKSGTKTTSKKLNINSEKPKESISSSNESLGSSSNNKTLRAISIARKLNPKVSF